MKKYLNLFEWDSLGNIPYSTHRVSELIKNVVSKNYGVFIEEDELAIYVKPKNCSSDKLVVIETHIDHPGYIINRRGEVVSVGSLYDSLLVEKLDIKKPKPVSFYSSEGDLLGDGLMTDIRALGNKLVAKAKPSGNISLTPNIQVLPKIKTGLFGDILHLRSVDNLATVFACVELIKYFSEKNYGVNVTFVFSKLEEVFQITATGIALKGRTPFENFQPDTSFLVLEAAPVCTGNLEDGPKLALAKAESGLLLDPDFANAGQHSVVQTAEQLGITVEMVDLKSHSDAISYLLVGGYRNVSCLLLHDKNRHNIDENGNFAAEQVNQLSIVQLIRLVKGAVVNITKSNFESGLDNRKLSDVEIAKKRQLIQAYKWAQPRLKLEKLFPTGFTDFFLFGLSTVLSRITCLIF